MTGHWQKGSVIFNARGQHPWMVSHACTPTALYLPEWDRIRIYFAPRNAGGQSIPTYLEVAASDPSSVMYLHDRPVLTLGERGTFDDGGIMPCSLVDAGGGRLHLYYVGWNPSVSVPYRNAVGLAVSEDGGESFFRPFPGAVVDRNRTEPFFTASPYALREGQDWHLWYASTTGFAESHDGRVEPVYVLKYAHSTDGVEWLRENRTLLAPASAQECTARPSVIKDGEVYKMWYCYRGSEDFRDGHDAYRIGYAESLQAATGWQRRDALAGISHAANGWDSTMQTYPNVIDTPHGRYLFYNGNGFGRTGLGYARWVQSS